MLCHTWITSREWSWNWMEWISGAVPIPIRCQITWLRPWHIFRPTHTHTQGEKKTNSCVDHIQQNHWHTVPAPHNNSVSCSNLPGNVELTYPLMVWYSFLLLLLLNLSLLLLSPTSPYQLLVSSNTAKNSTNAVFLLWPSSVKAPGRKHTHTHKQLMKTTLIIVQSHILQEHQQTQPLFPIKFHFYGK